VRRARQKRSATPVALAVSVLCGLTALYCTEVIFSNIDQPGATWRRHMAGVWIGTAVLVISLFLLERIGGRSNQQSFRSALPWTPLVALTGLATIVHISAVLVVTVIVFYSPWAYTQMKSHTRSH
jgi:hypothetical protein